MTPVDHKRAWTAVRNIRHSSTVGGGTMLLDDTGRCIGQIMVINVAPDIERRDIEHQVSLALAQYLEQDRRSEQSARLADSQIE